MSIGQALALTGVVRFSNNGRIISVNGVFIAGNVDTILRLNGRPIPQTLLYLPVHRGDVVGLQLVVTGPRGEEEYAPLLAEQVENNFEQLQRLEEEEQQ